MQVEAYFVGAKAVMLNTSRYWHGVAKDQVTGELTLTADSSVLPAAPSVSDPYAHWSWRFPATNNASTGMFCGTASGNNTYFAFMGDAANASALADASMYITSAANKERVFGWQLAKCDTLLPFVCELPFDGFACSPPPAPPPARPSPPPPPSPPAPPSCECCGPRNH